MNIQGISFLAGYASDWIYSWLQKKSVSRELNLSPEDRLCYDKIVKQLLKACEMRPCHPTLNPNAEIPQAYALIFRQSKSWKPVEQMLFDCPRSTPYVDGWCNQWILRIATLRYHQEKITKALAKLRDEENIYSQATITQLKQSIVVSRKALQNLIEEGEKDLNTNPKDPLVKALRSSQYAWSIRRFLIKNWVSLTVFAQSLEVPMDEDQFTVQVRKPKRLPPPDDPHPDEFFSKQVNDAVPALIIVQEENLEKTPSSYTGLEQPLTFIQPRKVKKIISTHASGAPSKTHFRLTDEVIFGIELDEPSPPPRLPTDNELRINAIVLLLSKQLT